MLLLGQRLGGNQVLFVCWLSLTSYLAGQLADWLTGSWQNQFYKIALNWARPGVETGGARRAGALINREREVPGLAWLYPVMLYKQCWCLFTARTNLHISALHSPTHQSGGRPDGSPAGQCGHLPGLRLHLSHGGPSHRGPAHSYPGYQWTHFCHCDPHYR